jgi:hypothetical protein
MAKTNFPSPGAFIDGGVGPRNPSPTTTGSSREKGDLDSRIRWLNSIESTARDARSVITQEMRRNMSLYEDRHWESFGSSRRAPWKLSGVLNYCAWTADRKAALLADNKPKVTYVTARREDDWQCEILNAAFDEVYEEEQLQAKLEGATKLSVIRKVAYLKTGYDPMRRHGKGGIAIQVVDGINVFVNREATSTHDCEWLLQVYTESFGVVMEKWKHLKGKPGLFIGGASENEDDQDDPASNSGGDSRIQPAQSYTDPTGATHHTAPYAAPQHDGEIARDGKRCLVREIWTRPRGPQYELEVKGLQFTVSGQVVTERKVIEFEDGHIEPLQTVVTEGNIVYELPMSTVHLMQWAADNIGGIKILSVEDTLEVVTKKVRVPLYPTGRRMIAVGNEIAEDGCNPFAHGNIPFVKFQENTSTKYYPRTTIDRIATLQDCLNRIFSMIFDAAHLTANPIWRLPLNSDLADEEVTNAPGAIQREDPNSLKMGKREAGPNMPAYVMQYMQFIISQIREIGGMTDTATGAKGKGQVSAETQSMFQEAAGVSFRPSLRLVEQSIVELGNQVRGLIGQFYTDNRYLELKQESGVERHVSFIGVRLTADMRMRAKAGSLMPTSPSARLNYVTNLMSTPAMDVPELLRNLEEVGIIESAAVLLKRLTKERNTPSLQWLIPSLQPAGGKQKKKPKPNGGKSSRGSTPQGASSRM